MVAAAIPVVRGVSDGKHPETVIADLASACKGPVSQAPRHDRKHRQGSYVSLSFLSAMGVSLRSLRPKSWRRTPGRVRPHGRRDPKE